MHLNDLYTTTDPLMAVLMKEENGNLKSYLEERRVQLYENAKPQETFLGMALDVAKAMAYLTELKVRLYAMTYNRNIFY